VFVGLTIPYYLLGMGKFVPILYLFKLDQVAWYLLSVWLIGKLSKSTKAQLFFALNPLILMEWLVNSHNDAIMITLLLASIYLYQISKAGWSFITLLLSIGIKYVTAAFLPLMFFPRFVRDNFQKVIHYLIVVFALVPLVYHYSWQYQPWYVTWLIPLAALSKNQTVRWTVGAYSLSVFSRYLYFVSTGSWLGSPLFHATSTFVLPVLVFLISSIFHLSPSKSKSTA
jgi:hypothetical protein